MPRRTGKWTLRFSTASSGCGAFGDGLRIGRVMAFFPRVADRGELGLGMQQPAAACGFELLRAARRPSSFR